MEETEVLAIKRVRFEKILNKYERIRNELRNVAIHRYNATRSAIRIAQRAGFKINDDR